MNSCGCQKNTPLNPEQIYRAWVVSIIVPNRAQYNLNVNVKVPKNCDIRTRPDEEEFLRQSNGTSTLREEQFLLQSKMEEEKANPSKGALPLIDYQMCFLS